MTYFVKESYFRPDVVQTSHTTTSAHVFNQYRLLLRQMQGDCVFVPIRDLQYQAVLTKDEVVFIDAMSGFALDEQGVGGRLIDIAWFWQSQGRESLSEPVPLKLLFYRNNLADKQRRLLSSFPAAMKEKLHANEKRTNIVENCRILPFKPPVKG